MTRFEMNLNGKFGEYWKKDAEREITMMQERADNGEILLDGNFAAYWEKSGHYLPEECCEILEHCTFFFDADATKEARARADAEFFANYLNTKHELSYEARMEMRNAFGEGTKVVDVISGEVYIA